MKNQSKVQSYYKFHSQIYDLTRWTFLFGRKSLVNQLTNFINEDTKILEIGCGTGSLLKDLEENTNAKLYGIDMSSEMLEKASKKLERTELINQKFEKGLFPEASFDIIIVSYFLTFFKEKDSILETIKHYLKPDGLLANVDFWNANHKLYNKFMLKNNIIIDSNLKNELNKNFSSVYDYSNKAYGGIWDFYLFIGRNSRQDKYERSTFS